MEVKIGGVQYDLTDEQVVELKKQGTQRRMEFKEIGCESIPVEIITQVGTSIILYVFNKTLDKLFEQWNKKK